jgi:HD-GYP domain-containing protein (c-di-GMP phosphodiesterase class II)
MKSGSNEKWIDSEPLALPEALLGHFFRLIQAVKFHQVNNPIVTQSLRDFIETLQQFASDDHWVTIRILEGRLFFQEEKLTCRSESTLLIANVIHYFEIRKLHGLSLSTALQFQQGSELLVFATLLNSTENRDDPEPWLERQIQKMNFDWIKILREAQRPLEQTDGEANASDRSAAVLDSRPDRRRLESGQNAYAGALTALKEIATKVTSDRPGGVRKALRVVQNMVDMIMEDDFVLLGLSTIRDFDDYTYVHSVNVGILAMALGARIGLSRDALEMIGICGLFHDLGKTEIPLHIINKPGQLTSHEREEVQKHVLHGVRLILKLIAPRNLRSKIIIAPYEHHLKYDLSGYPQTTPKKATLSLHGRIVAIADVYDALTSPRIYRDQELSPQRALEIMAKGAGTDFDPILFKVFIKMIGIYPLGTLVKLDSGEIGLVTKSYQETDPLRPCVVLLESVGQNKLKRGNTVRLSETSVPAGSYKRNIVESYHPCLYGIQPAQYLL